MGYLSTGIDASDVGDEVQAAAGVTPLVVVPGDELDEVLVEGDTGSSIEDGGVVVTGEISGDKSILGVAKNTLEGTLGSGLDGSLDLVVGDGLLETAGKVDDGDVLGGDTEGHTGELTLESGDDLGDSLSGTGAAGDDVGSSGTATTPVLSGGTVNGLLGGSVGVDSGHETLNDTELIVDDLGERSQAVGGARSVGEDIDVRGVLLQVDTDDEHGGISRRSRDDDLLGTSLQVSRGLLLGGEDTSGLDDVLSTRGSPWDVGGVTLLGEGNLLAVDSEAVVIRGDRAVEAAVGRVILEHVGLEGLLEECCPQKKYGRGVKLTA